MKNRILFVINGVTYGGAEKILILLAANLAKNNEIYLFTYENDDLHYSLEQKVIHIRHLDLKFPVFFFRRIEQIINVRSVIKKIRPDIIISFLTYPNIISIIAKFKTGVPNIISERGDPFVNHGWFTKFRDFFYQFADGYVFQTKYALNYYANNKRILPKSIVISNPIEPPDNLPSKNGQRENLIVNVARFEIKQKRQDILIKAFNKISEKYGDIKLVLYGDGEDEDKIKQHIADEKLENRIILGGVTNNIYSAINRAKLFVLSSDYEGIPNALLEAMELGLPCVTTDYSPGGARDIIVDHKNGLIIKSGDIVQLANAIEFVLANPEAAEAMGNEARNITSNYDPKVIFQEWEDYIQVTLNHHRED